MLESKLLTLAMPTPRTLRAPAVWITARSWALAGVERFGAARVVTPDGEIRLDELGNLVDSLLSGVPTAVPKRGRFATETRTLVKDLRLATRHIRGSRRLPEPSHRVPRHAPFAWQHHDPFFTLGERFAQGCDLPLVVFVDAPHVWEARRWGVRRPGWARLLERLGEAPQLQVADLIACVSDDVANAVQDIAGPAARVLVTPCTADPAFFSETQAGRAVRAELDFAPQDVIVGWAGSFRSFHALDDLITAFDRVAADSPELQLLLVGDGPDQRRLVDLATSARAANRITFAGQVPYTRMPAYVAAIDIAVVTARDAASFHYSPLKLREYRAAARAIVAAEAGQVASTVQDGRDGLLYRPGDVYDLSRAIQAFARDSDLREALGSQARAAERQGGGASSQISLVLHALDRSV